MSKWREVPADEIAENIAIGPFGSRMKADCYVDRGVPIIRGNNITDTKALAGEFVFITEEMAKGMSACNAYDGDLVFPHCGLIGEVGIVTGGKDAHFFISSSLMKLTPKREIADPLFYFYFYRSPAGRHELLKNASQVGTPGIATPLTSLRATRVPLPPLPEQRAIAAVLGALDDKIELNRRMNDTLEALAQSLFKSWFVDATQSALPKGWRESTIGELCEFAYGKALKAETRRAGSIPVYGSNGRVGWHHEALVKGPGIVVGRKGNPGIVIWSPTDFFPIDTTFYVVPKGECRSLYFLFHALRAHDLASLGADSAVPGLNRNMAYVSKEVLPPAYVQEAFDKQVRPLFERVHHNNEESRTLAALRDALLPKLLSGELSVKEAYA